MRGNYPETSKSEKFWNKYRMRFLATVWIIAGVYFVSFHWAIAPMAYLTDRGNIMKIEQLREDVKKVNPAEAEDVIGQITEWNQKIKSTKYYNSIPIIELYIPDYWEDVKLIEIPKRGVWRYNDDVQK